jgi:hypothetical protein
VPGCADGNATGVACAAEAAFGGAPGLPLWLTPPTTPNRASGVGATITVDGSDSWQLGVSPVVLAEARRPAAGLVAFTSAPLHAGAPLLRRPALTALEYVFAHPQLTLYAALVNATCACPPPATTPGVGGDGNPDAATCWRSWLCVVLDSGAFTSLLPIDAGWAALTPEALDVLFADPAAGYATLAYHVIGPAALSRGPGAPYLDLYGEADGRQAGADGMGVRRRLSRRQRRAAAAAGQAMGRAVNALQRFAINARSTTTISNFYYNIVFVSSRCTRWYDHLCNRHPLLSTFSLRSVACA